MPRRLWMMLHEPSSPQGPGITGTVLQPIADTETEWVTVGASGKLATSPDGITWTQQAPGFGTGTIYAVAHD